MNAQLCQLFGWSSDPADTQSEIFIRTLSVVAFIAAVAHTIFLLLFGLLGVKELALFNVLSVAVYAASLRWVREHPLLIEAVMGVEIIVHALLAVHLIGWESGFHFYIILIIPVAIVSGGVNAKHWMVVRWIGSLGVALLYLLADALMHQLTPLHTLPTPVMAWLRTFNLAGTFLILGLLGTVYRQLVLQAESVLRYQACTDPLTHLHNRRSALDVVQREVALFQRQGRPLAVVLGDVDHFKLINDKHGHHAGDAVLQSTAQVLQGAVRQMDHVARWGGEEFLIVLPGTEPDEAYAVAERLRAQVAAHVSHSAKGPIPVTMTLGLADLRPGDTVEQLISRADQALYQGKTAGRNRVVVAS